MSTLRLLNHLCDGMLESPEVRGSRHALYPRRPSSFVKRSDLCADCANGLQRHFQPRRQTDSDGLLSRCRLGFSYKSSKHAFRFGTSEG
jgi:hypothetical protein